MTVRIDGSLEGIDWAQAKADLAADDFDNGRSPRALRTSFEHSQHVAIARTDDRVVGMARYASLGFRPPARVHVRHRSTWLANAANEP